MSNGLDGVKDSNLSRMQNLQGKGNKKSEYIPDNDYGQDGMAADNPGYTMESVFPRNDLGFGRDRLLKEIGNTQFILPEDTVYQEEALPYREIIKQEPRELQEEKIEVEVVDDGNGHYIGAPTHEAFMDLVLKG